MENKNDIRFFLDIGNKNIKILVGETSPNYDRMEVLAYFESLSQGLKKSVVHDINLLSLSIKNVIEKAIEKLKKNNINIDFDDLKINLCISALITKTENIHNKIVFDEKIIDDKDMDNFLNSALKNHFTDFDDYYVVCSENYNIKIDDGKIIKNPIGKQGTNLQADINVVYVDKKEINKYFSAINKLGYDVENLYLNSYMSARSILTEKQLKEGAVVIDLGYASTDIVFIKNNKLINSLSLPVGEMHFISDIHYILDIDLESAENVYNIYKNAIVKKDEFIEYSNKRITINDLKNIIDARIGDMAEFVDNFLNKAPFTYSDREKVLVTGGLVNVFGVVEKLSELSNCKIHKQLPFNFKGIDNINYNMASIIGSFIYEIYKEYTNKEFTESLNEINLNEIEKKNIEYNTDYVKENYEIENMKINESDFIRYNTISDVIDNTINDEIFDTDEKKDSKISKVFNFIKKIM